MKQADRIAELERRVRELEARPPQVVHVPVFAPYVPAQPVWPVAPHWPNPWSPIITCDATKGFRGEVAVTGSLHQ